MPSLRGVALLGVVCLVACHAPIRDWRDLARRSGCTPELLAETRRYRPEEVGELPGRYVLIQVDTTAGWIDMEREDGTVGKHDVLNLWAPDSLHRWSRGFPWAKSTRRVSADIPIMGQLAGYERTGFTVDRPQAEITGPTYGALVVQFAPYPVMDGKMWELPIQRRGAWGFGGYVEEHNLVVPIGPDGKGLEQRAGYYCAFRS